MGRQLNIRSDEAYVLAHKLARKQKRSVTAVVVDALREQEKSMQPAEDIYSEQAVEERLKQLNALIAKFKGSLEPGITSDHSDMYDEHGLPI
jgi:antitoxin VapB